jgi:hypothetical protein
MLWLIWICGGSSGNMVAHLERRWLSWSCGVSSEDMMAYLDMWWLV